MSWILNRRNKKWSKKLGWTPIDFDCKEFNNALVIAIRYFQREHELIEDGVCGPNTYRLLLTSQASASTSPDGNNGTSILVNGQWVDIGHPTRWMPLPNKNIKKVTKVRRPSCVVIHHDVTISADVCFRALLNQGYSSHFCIDNDGTICQFADTNHITLHAGVSYYRNKKRKRTKYRSRNLNNVSIGIDLSNAFYTKYNPTYVKMGFEKRKVLKNHKIHGIKIRDHLDMYPEQINALKVLAKFINSHYDIPLEAPEKDGKFLKGWDEDCMKGTHHGFQVHYNSSINKIDTDIELKEIMDEIKEG